jgi:hypothetical protein
MNMQQQLLVLSFKLAQILCAFSNFKLALPDKG